MFFGMTITTEPCTLNLKPQLLQTWYIASQRLMFEAWMLGICGTAPPPPVSSAAAPNADSALFSAGASPPVNALSSVRMKLKPRWSTGISGRSKSFDA